MSKKVYCRNCRYRKPNQVYCNPIIEEIDDWFSASTQYVKRTSCKESNRINDCAYYKRKWWKFWVK